MRSQKSQRIKCLAWLPRWLSGKESTRQRRGHGFDPWSRKIPRARGQLSSCAAKAEPTHHNHGSEGAESLRSAGRGAGVLPLQSSPGPPPLEKAAQREARSSRRKHTHLGNTHIFSFFKVCLTEQALKCCLLPFVSFMEEKM